MFLWSSGCGGYFCSSRWWSWGGLCRAWTWLWCCWAWLSLVTTLAGLVPRLAPTLAINVIITVAIFTNKVISHTSTSVNNILVTGIWAHRGTGIWTLLVAAIGKHLIPGIWVHDNNTVLMLVIPNTMRMIMIMVIIWTTSRTALRVNRFTASRMLASSSGRGWGLGAAWCDLSSRGSCLGLGRCRSSGRVDRALSACTC